MTTLRILAAVAASVCLTQAASAAEPPALFGVAHIGNESTAKATVYYKWGNGAWRKTVIARGQKMAFAYPYDGASKKSPALLVRIDVDTDGVRYVEHSLSRSQSPDDNSARFGHHFAIRQVAGTDTRYIEAVTAGAQVKITDSSTSRP